LADIQPVPRSDDKGTGRLELEVALHLITESMLDMIVQIDDQGIRRYVSQSVKPVLGYEAADLVGESIFAQVHPDDIAAVLEVFSQGMQEPMSGIVEARYLHADGHYVWLETTGKTIEDADGKVTGGIVISRNIDRRKQVEEELMRLNQELERRVAERTAQLKAANRDLADHLRAVEEAWEAVRKSEEYYHMIMENAGDAILVLDVESRKIVDCNHRATVLTGMAFEEILGKELHQLQPLRSAADYEPYIQEVLRLQSIPSREIEARDRQGRKAWGEYSGSVYEIDGRQLVVVMVRDITRRKREEIRLIEVEEKYREQAESDFLLIRLDLEGKLTYLNDWARRRYVASGGEPVGKSVLGVVVEDTEAGRRALDGLLLSVIRSPEERVVKELDCISGAAGEHRVEWTARAIRDEQGHVAGASLTGLDVTARHLREQELMGHLEELRRKLEAR
jgi:PAS domain S-box-containing protein